MVGLLVALMAFAPWQCLASDAIRSQIMKAVREKPVCNDKAVVAMIKDFAADADLVLEMAKSGCQESLAWACKSLLKNGPEMAKAVDAYLEHFYKKELPHLRQNLAEDSDQTLFENIAYVLGVLNSAAQKGCRNKATALCEKEPETTKAFTELNSIITAQQRKGNSMLPDEIMPVACKLYFDVKFTERRVERERDAAKISGLVDRKMMYEAGQDIAEGRRKLKRMAGDYKALSGKPLVLERCSQSYNGWANTSLGTD